VLQTVTRVLQTGVEPQSGQEEPKPGQKEPKNPGSKTKNPLSGGSSSIHNVTGDDLAKPHRPAPEPKPRKRPMSHEEAIAAYSKKPPDSETEPESKHETFDDLRRRLAEAAKIAPEAEDGDGQSWGDGF
jgi:hypothetical protein